jgi:hypothetical protein
MSNLLTSAIIVLILSVVGFLWGNSYVNAHPFVGIASVFGASDPTYSTAQSAILLGVLGFLLGLGLLIAALVRGNTPKSDAPTATANVAASSASNSEQQQSLGGDVGQQFHAGSGNTVAHTEPVTRVLQQVSTAKFCSGCGAAVVAAGSAYCAECGAKL